jgi:hypothetical protein
MARDITLEGSPNSQTLVWDLAAKQTYKMLRIMLKEIDYD